MNLTVELPPPINEELAQESLREGISETEHAALLLCLAAAFKQEGPYTAFQSAVRVFISHQSLEASQVFSAFENLILVCLDHHDAGKISRDLQATHGPDGSRPEYESLKRWRDITVHQPNPPIDSLLHPQGRLARHTPPQQGRIDPNEHVQALLAQWQSEDNTPIRPPIPTLPGETPTRALFRKWEEEDAKMTDEERDAEDTLWEDIEQGLKQNDKALRLRHLG
jgi:hypothetical protein